MSEIIEIEDGAVRVIERKLVKSVTFAAFQRELNERPSYRTPLMPVGTILYAKQDEKSLYVIEQQPQIRTIRHRYEEEAVDDEHDDVEEELDHTIALPWVYMFACFREFAFDNLYVYLAPHRVTSMRDMLCYAPFPNLDTDGRACLGDTKFDVTSSVAARVARVAEEYWRTTFNMDLDDLYQCYMPHKIVELRPGYSAFGGWAKLKPEEVLGLPWTAYKNVETLVDYIVGEEA